MGEVAELREAGEGSAIFQLCGLSPGVPVFGLGLP